MGTILDGKKYTNKLIDEDSPYLKQHAHNPVDWYPWGDEAFQKAKKEHKLIFLSIGYSTCHWCHVMERESFENEQVAAILNESFISIKIDREEMPHIDKYYQDLYTLLNRRGGGWPLTIVMTPQAKAFFAATYIPAENRESRAGMKRILSFLSDGFKNEKEEILKSADLIEAAMKNNTMKKIGNPTELNLELVSKYINNLNTMFDKKYGGLVGAPKFPHAATFDVMLDIYGVTKDETALKLSQAALDAMAKGGIYDQIEGGFYRYSVDEKWIIPHFEKMLYTNAELLEVYAKAYMLTKEPLYREIVEEIVTFVEKRFTKNHLLYSASDADSDGGEGTYFVYSYKEIMDAFEDKKEAKEITVYFNITTSGNFEHGMSNPYITDSKKPKNLPQIKEKLLAIRAERNYPFIDDKILTSWNTLYIKALFIAGAIEEKYRDNALTLLDSLLENLYIDGTLFHQRLIDKKPKVKALLEDYAFLISALISAYESGFDAHYLELAKKLCDEACSRFYSDGLWKMADDDFTMIADFEDKTYRSAAAVMIENLLNLAALGNNLSLQRSAEKILMENAYLLEKNPGNYPYLLKAYLQFKKGNIIIKSTKENLLKAKTHIEALGYPFVRYKVEETPKYQACTMESCFASENSLEKLLEDIKNRWNINLH